MRLVSSLLLAMFMLLVMATPAFAGDGAGAEALLNVDLWTVIITIAVFIILLLVLSKTAWKPILGALKQREETIAKALDDAKAANERAQEKIAEYEAKIQHAKEEAQEIADEARRDADEIRQRMQADAKTESDAMIERAKREIDQLTAKAWEHLVGDAAAISTEAARRIIGKELDETGHAAIVADVVSQFARSGGGSA